LQGNYRYERAGVCYCRAPRLSPSPTPVPQCAATPSPVFPVIGNHTIVMSVRDERPLTAREQVEYTALRTTILQRGTTRVCIFAGGIVAWGALATATAAVSSAPVLSLVPLVVLAAVFEAVFALHIGVERVGRYLQVFYEALPDESSPSTPAGRETTGSRWEHVAMNFGRPAGAASADALFTAVFLLAGALNMVPALIPGPTQAELIFVGGAHALFVVRLVAARAAAAKQRSIDLARFQELSGRG
jgi:hypothetical protein